MFPIIRTTQTIASTPFTHDPRIHSRAPTPNNPVASVFIASSPLRPDNGLLACVCVLPSHYKLVIGPCSSAFSHVQLNLLRAHRARASVRRASPYVSTPNPICVYGAGTILPLCHCTIDADDDVDSADCRCWSACLRMCAQPPMIWNFICIFSFGRVVKPAPSFDSSTPGRMQGQQDAHIGSLRTSRPTSKIAYNMEEPTLTLEHTQL